MTTALRARAVEGKTNLSVCFYCKMLKAQDSFSGIKFQILIKDEQILAAATNIGYGAVKYFDLKQVSLFVSRAYF